MLIDTSHELRDGYSRVITVDRQVDSVDYALVGLLTREDVVVTRDFGLAAMALGEMHTHCTGSEKKPPCSSCGRDGMG